MKVIAYSLLCLFFPVITISESKAVKIITLGIGVEFGSEEDVELEVVVCVKVDVVLLVSDPGTKYP
jgi:hypothetical protein